MKKRFFKQLLKRKNYVDIVSAIAFRPQSIPVDLNNIKPDELNSIIETAKRLKRVEALFRLLDMNIKSINPNSILYFIVKNCAANLVSKTNSNLKSTLGYNPFEKYFEGLTKYAFLLQNNTLIKKLAIAASNLNNKEYIYAISNHCADIPELLVFIIDLPGFDENDNLYRRYITKMPYCNLVKMLELGSKYDELVIKISISGISKTLNDFKDNEEVFNKIYNYIWNMDNEDEISYQLKIKTLYEILILKPNFNRKEILDYVLLNKQYVKSLFIDYINILDEKEQIYYGQKVLEEQNVDKIKQFAVHTDCTETYILIDYLLSLRIYYSTHIFLICNLKGRFLNYAVDQLIKIYGINYLFTILRDKVDDVTFLLVLVFLENYNYISDFNEEEKNYLYERKEALEKQPVKELILKK